jgi:hypothetical protein
LNQTRVAVWRAFGDERGQGGDQQVDQAEAAQLMAVRDDVIGVVIGAGFNCGEGSQDMGVLRQQAGCQKGEGNCKGCEGDGIGAFAACQDEKGCGQCQPEDDEQGEGHGAMNFGAAL